MLSVNNAIAKVATRHLENVCVSCGSIVGTIPASDDAKVVFTVAIEDAHIWNTRPNHEYDIILSCVQVEDASSRMTTLPTNIRWGNKFSDYIRKMNIPAHNIEAHLEELSREIISKNL
jgi:hypothetical protein